MTPPRLPALVLAALGLGACARAPTVQSAIQPPPPRTRLELAPAHGHGPAVAIVPRTGVDPLVLSLWIDAGSRDADPPQLAALAAEAAAREVSPDLRAQVLPDATRFELDCPARKLAECAALLGRVLQPRSHSPDMLGNALEWLTAGRRRALADAPERMAQQLALTALLGPAAASLNPLGDAALDGMLDTARVQAFWAAHYGPSRALIVAVGAVTPDDATLRALREPLLGAPAATQQRAERLGLTSNIAIEVGVDDRDRLWLALGGGSLGELQARAESLRRELVERRGLAKHVRSQGFELREDAFVLVEVDGGNPRELVEVVATSWGRDQKEWQVTAPPRPAPDDLDALAAAQAFTWLELGTNLRTGCVQGLGVGVTVAGGRGDRPKDADPDAWLRERAQTELQARLAAGLARTRPELTYASESPSVTSATLTNGARITADLGEGSTAAITVRFEPGAAADPPALHGRSALLATLSSHACRGYGPLRLRDALREHGVELMPELDADGWGLAARFPVERWAAAIDLVLHCALEPALDARHVGSARLALRERIDTPVGRALAAAAQSLAPLAPGALAPWGDADRVANLSAAELTAFGNASRRGPRTRVSLAGELPKDAIEAVARRLVELPDGAGAAPPAPLGELPKSETAESLAAAGPSAQAVLLLWRMPQVDAALARAFAALLADALHGTAGLQLRWHGGGDTAGQWSWAALRLSVEGSALTTLPSTVARLQATVTAARLAEAADAVAAAEARGQAATLGSALGRARYLLSPEPSSRPSTTTTDDGPAVHQQAAQKWLAQPPVFRLVDVR